MVTTASYDSSPSAILKQWYIGPIRDQLNNATFMLSKLKRNTRDLRGNQAEISLHTSRNVGVGARAIGVQLPQRGKQGHTKTYTDLKFNYGRAYLDGPNVEKTRGNRAAFAALADVELKGMTRDIQQEITRQLNGDGTGWLALTGAVGSTTTSGTNTMVPYLWAPANKYLKNRDNLELQWCDLSGDVHLPASDDGVSKTAQVVSATTTNVTLAHDTAAPGAILAGDPVGIWRSIQTAAAASVTRYEMMGLAGIINDQNLPGDADWLLDGERTSGGSTATPTNPESVAGGYTLVDLGHQTTNELQSVDATAKDWWRSYIDGNSGIPRSLSLQMMDDVAENQEVTEGVEIDAICTTGKIKNRYMDLLRAERRYVNTMTLDGGFKAVEYNGIPLLADKDCPRGRMNFVNMDSLALFVGKEFDFLGGGQNGEYLHWITGYDAYEIVLRYYAELGCFRRNANAAIVDIDES